MRVRADDLASLYSDAASGLFSIIVANQNEIRPVKQRRLAIDGAQPDLLLFDWLNELLYLYDTEQLLLRRFEVETSAEGLTADVRGEPIDMSRHHLEHEVKAITYHGLLVRPDGEGWLAEVIVDI